MSTVIRLAPSSLTRSTALFFVLSDVPKHGIVTQIMSFLLYFKRSKAFTVTRSASVESRPPEIPITAALDLMWAILLTRPRD